MELCVTRFSNKTQYENIKYNLKLPRDQAVQEHREMFRNWKIKKIPHIEKLIDNCRHQFHRTEDKKERYKHRQQLAVYRKDIALLRQAETNYYGDVLNDVITKEAPQMCMTNEWVYNVPIAIHPSINKRMLYVIEMNNDGNKVTAITKLSNRCYHRRYDMYDDNNYNRYSYRGVRMLMTDDSALGKFRTEIEDSLFKGSTHQKRGQGIQKVAKNNLEKIEHKGLFTLLDKLFDNMDNTDPKDYEGQTTE